MTVQTPEAAFVQLCRELRELGAIEVSRGDFHVKFGAPKVIISPKKDAADRDPDEWRQRAATGR